jgi:Mce-associated membrane protein
MADLNDPVDPAKAEDTTVAEKPEEAKPADPAADAKPTETAETPKDAKAEAPTATETAEPADEAEVDESAAEAEPVTEKSAEKVETVSEPADEKPAAEATPAPEATPAVDEKPAAEATPAVDEKPAAEATPAADAETESGTVLPDSIVSGAAASSAVSADSDEDEDADADDEAASLAAKPARKPRRKLSRPRPLVAALSLLLVVLLAAGVTLFVHNHRVSAAEASKAAALDTARQIATSLTTITPDNAAGQLDSLTKQSTGSFKDQIAGYSAMFQAVLKQGNVASRGTITAAGIEKMEGDAASALVAVSALITSGQVPQGQPRTYRLLVSLQRAGGQWLVSNVDFVQ